MDVLLDESKVPAYTLPDPLAGVATPDEWTRSRRGEILRLFCDEVYGWSPPRPTPGAALREASSPALGGMALRRQTRIPLGPDDLGPDGGPHLDLMLTLPAEAKEPVPVFLALNFWGNHATHPDRSIWLSERWMENSADHGIEAHRATQASRGASQSRWPVETIVARGFGLATFCRADIEPDHPEGHRDGIRSRLRADAPAEHQWGAISAWAWALRVALDQLEREPRVDARRVIALGHSRLGKAALWAAAQDERFAMAISNDSGCMGAALSRRCFGETVAIIQHLFPHWFAPAFTAYAQREPDLPVDQHMLLALVAPRPLYVASAVEDRWADPLGEFLSAREASRVYSLLGHAGIPGDAAPALGRRLGARVGYHVRPGGHDLTPTDWGHFLDFADAQLAVRNS